MEKFRWEKGDDHISIESVISTNLNQAALIVDSSIEFQKLPSSFNRQVAASDEFDIKDFINNVKTYAEENNFISIDLESKT